MDNGMDGVDFDREYPGAPDIPGILAGSLEDGANYLESLKMVRAALPGQYPTRFIDCSFHGRDPDQGVTAPYWHQYGLPGRVMRTDGGRKLRDEEDGRDAPTGWGWHSPTPSSYPLVYFNIDFFIKAGCIERAIVSASGPKISCECMGLDFKKRSREPEPIMVEDGGEPGSRAERGRRAAVTVSASYPRPSSTPSYTYPASVTAMPVYVPMTWTGADREPAALTSTLTSETVAVFTNAVLTMPSMTSAPSVTRRK
ncbi:hypothetical protein AAE478_009473 [Parahypoxylon ruwenzoriense]